ncbi:potassium transporter [Dactylonectria macrodidyma]|uniref:Potassium transport protein n=1 Tax=Dactylonectria macrodidyma TaxID=307937 RepID=A0A9P9D813_9HYPO|nr:potassium transporter [Dactylonectria macrodidyma]
MWRPSLNFVTLHYAYIIFMGLLSIPILYPYGNLKAIDAYFFGASASTESGLNTVDVNLLKTYQQLYIYFIPILTNLGFINIVVVVVRLIWFKKHLEEVAPYLLRGPRHQSDEIHKDLEFAAKDASTTDASDARTSAIATGHDSYAPKRSEQPPSQVAKSDVDVPPEQTRDVGRDDEKATESEPQPRITFDPAAGHHPRRETTLYIPSPRDRDQGQPIVELKDPRVSRDDLSIHEIPGLSTSSTSQIRHRRLDGPRLGSARSLERVATVASSMFVFGRELRKERSNVSTQRPAPATDDFPQLSCQVTVGRNSNFLNLTSRDREELGGIEYRSLKLLLKIVVGYFFGLHLFGAICLVGWIQYANPKYRDYLNECGQDKIWWAFYSAQTMLDNLGFTLTPDSMIHFNDAVWPMLSMSFIALAGNTFYPVFLRFVIWTMSKTMPRNSSVQEPLSFLLNHPRRCYTLLFPSGTTWALCGILVVLNFIDTLLIIVLDLKNEAVANLSPGLRVAAAIFQAVSSRHTGTASFNLAGVNPAVQISLLVMMYISVFPIALAIRSSNTYEERGLGIYESEKQCDEDTGKAYLLSHIQNQLSFDLWYIFLGIFCICIAEAGHIMDDDDPAFAVFPIFFEVVSAYGNVGLSLGYPTISASLSGKFSTFSKLVICAMMIRGRHRGLPYELDRAIVLPNEQLVEDGVAPQTLTAMICVCRRPSIPCRHEHHA